MATDAEIEQTEQLLRDYLGSIAREIALPDQIIIVIQRAKMTAARNDELRGSLNTYESALVHYTHGKDPQPAMVALGHRYTHRGYQ